MQLFRNILRYLPLLIAAMGVASCSSDSTIEEEKTVDMRIPMVFGTTLSSAENTVTRSTILESNFKVCTWKNFGSTIDVVMDQYQVNYDASSSPKWYYEDVNSQKLRYWDLGAFTYEFRAIAPYDDSNTTITLDGITVNASYNSQTYKGGTVSPTTATEPYWVSQVQRRQDGTNYPDYDMLKKENNNVVEINETSKGVATREVHMPFHHLVSQVGFKLYINNLLVEEGYTVTLKSIEISVVDAKDKFITAGTVYTANSTDGLTNGSFTTATKAAEGDVTSAGEYTLLRHDEYTGVDLHKHMTHDNAYDLINNTSPCYLQQIPQGNIKLHVKATIVTDHQAGVPNTYNYDRLLSFDIDKLDGDVFTWKPDTRYIYYLYIADVHNQNIIVQTCEVLPWAEIGSSSITVDLE